MQRMLFVAAVRSSIHLSRQLGFPCCITNYVNSRLCYVCACGTYSSWSVHQNLRSSMGTEGEIQGDNCHSWLCWKGSYSKSTASMKVPRLSWCAWLWSSEPYLQSRDPEIRSSIGSFPLDRADTVVLHSNVYRNRVVTSLL